MTNLKPFNLERALAGDPVITISGIKVFEILFSKINRKFPLIVTLENDPCRDGYSLYDINGNSISTLSDKNDWQLFMAPKTKKVYLYVCKVESNFGYFPVSDAYDNKTDLLNKIVNTNKYQLVEVDLEDAEEEPIKPPVTKTKKVYLYVCKKQESSEYWMTTNAISSPEYRQELYYGRLDGMENENDWQLVEVDLEDVEEEHIIHASDLPPNTHIENPVKKTKSLWIAVNKIQDEDADTNCHVLSYYGYSDLEVLKKNVGDNYNHFIQIEVPEES